jgi:hypothetical protein
LESTKARFTIGIMLIAKMVLKDCFPTKRASNRQWNSIPQEQKNLVVKLALDYPDLSSRELAYKMTDEQQIFLSESSVYRILKVKRINHSSSSYFPECS